MPRWSYEQRLSAHELLTKLKKRGSVIAKHSRWFHNARMPRYVKRNQGSEVTHMKFSNPPQISPPLPRQRLLHLLWSKVTELRRLSAHQHCRQFRTQGTDKGCADVILYCSTAVSKIDSILPLHREDQPYLLAELEAEVLEIRQLDRAVVMADLQKHSGWAMHGIGRCR